MTPSTRLDRVEIGGNASTEIETGFQVGGSVSDVFNGGCYSD